jgi:hypothetical protein
MCSTGQWSLDRRLRPKPLATMKAWLVVSAEGKVKAAAKPKEILALGDS